MAWLLWDQPTTLWVHLKITTSERIHVWQFNSGERKTKYKNVAMARAVWGPRESVNSMVSNCLLGWHPEINALRFHWRSFSFQWHVVNAEACDCLRYWESVTVTCSVLNGTFFTTPSEAQRTLSKRVWEEFPRWWREVFGNVIFLISHSYYSNELNSNYSCLPWACPRLGVSTLSHWWSETWIMKGEKGRGVIVFSWIATTEPARSQ